MLTIFTHHVRAEIIITVLPAAQGCFFYDKQRINQNASANVTDVN